MVFRLARTNPTKQNLVKRQIKLGWHLDKYGEPTGRIIAMPYPIKDGRFKSKNYLVAGPPESGKSVTAKLILFELYKGGRPLMCFDGPGMDLYLMRLPNSQPWRINANGSRTYLLPPGQQPEGIPGIYLYYPAGSRSRASWELEVKPNLCKYDEKQLEKLGFSTGAAIYLRNTIFPKYGPFKDLDCLIEFVQHFPSNEASSVKTIARVKSGTLKLKHGKNYQLNDTLPNASKDSLLKILPMLKNLNIFNTDDSQEYKQFERHVMQGKNIVFSFNSILLAKLEVPYYMNALERLKKKYGDSCPAYVTDIEEAHLIFADEGLDYLTLTNRKLGFSLMLQLPEVLSISDGALATFKHLILGAFRGKNAHRLGDSSGKRALTWMLNSLVLDTERTPEIRQMLYYSYYKKDDYWRLMPFVCPQEIHRE